MNFFEKLLEGTSIEGSKLKSVTISKEINLVPTEALNEYQDKF